MEAQVCIHLAGGIAEAIHQGVRGGREALWFAEVHCGVGTDLTKVEAVLRRYKTHYELRQSSAEEVSYLVTAPFDMHTDRVSNALSALADGKSEVKWDEKPKAKVK